MIPVEQNFLSDGWVWDSLTSFFRNLESQTGADGLDKDDSMILSISRAKVRRTNHLNRHTKYIRSRKLVVAPRHIHES
jgi:hypothetical protein